MPTQFRLSPIVPLYFCPQHHLPLHFFYSRNFHKRAEQSTRGSGVVRWPHAAVAKGSGIRLCLPCLRANEALLLHNARLAAELAAVLAGHA
jgi:hypothetical protein